MSELNNVNQVLELDVTEVSSYFSPLFLHYLHEYTFFLYPIGAYMHLQNVVICCSTTHMRNANKILGLHSKGLTLVQT